MKSKLIFTCLLLFAANSFARNVMVDPFITGVGGNYGGASIADSANHINGEVADRALALCQLRGEVVREIYDVKIGLEASYLPISPHKDGIFSTISQTNPIWSFSARVHCQAKAL